MTIPRINGPQARALHEAGKPVQVAFNGEWLHVEDKHKRLFNSPLAVFRTAEPDESPLFSEVKARRVCLDACPRHSFDLGPMPFSIGDKANCLRCGVPMSLTNIGDYIRGYIAAGGDPCDIVKDWYGEDVSSAHLWHSVEHVRCPHCSGTGSTSHQDMLCDLCFGRGSLDREAALSYLNRPCDGVNNK